MTWQGYDINGYTFYTAAKDKKSISQNSGVRIEALDDRTGQNITYYGIIDDIQELDYGANIQIPVFRCRWVKYPQSVEVDDYGLIIVNLDNVGYKDDPWVLASQVAQVLYVIDPSKKQKHTFVLGNEDVEQYNQYEEMDLFTDLPQKMKVLEGRIKKDVMPWSRMDG